MSGLQRAVVGEKRRPAEREIPQPCEIAAVLAVTVAGRAASDGLEPAPENLLVIETASVACDSQQGFLQGAERLVRMVGSDNDDRALLLLRRR